MRTAGRFLDPVRRWVLLMLRQRSHVEGYTKRIMASVWKEELQVEMVRFVDSDRQLGVSAGVLHVRRFLLRWL